MYAQRVFQMTPAFCLAFFRRNFVPKKIWRKISWCIYFSSVISLCSMK